MSSSAPRFERDVKPLFRDEDVDSMEFAFDLRSYEEVTANAEDIYDRLEDGSMPCDGEWSTEQVQLFRDWIDSGLHQ